MAKKKEIQPIGKRIRRARLGKKISLDMMANETGMSKEMIKSIESGEATTVPILFRSFVEAYLDFCSLCKDAHYGNHMQAAYLKEWIRVLEEAKDTGNPFLKDIAELDTLDKQIEEH